MKVSPDSAADLIARLLKRRGVARVFALCGGHIMPIWMRLDAEGISIIDVRDERAAVHMAQAHAELTGELGVALVTAGPGMTNAITGIANAYMDSIPLVCITGQVPTHLIGNDAFQECDTVGITRPCTKHNWLVRNVNDLAKVLHEAFYVATTGRPGPVVVDVPKDVQNWSGVFAGEGQLPIPGTSPTLRASRATRPRSAKRWRCWLRPGVR